MRQLIHLDTIPALEVLLETADREPVLLFKHSSSCPLSAYAFHELMTYLQKNSSPIACGLVIVQKARRVSDEIATRFSVQHESPQAILLENQKVVWHGSHNRITEETLNDVTRQYGSKKAVVSAENHSHVIHSGPAVSEMCKVR